MTDPRRRTPELPVATPGRPLPTGAGRSYVRLAALGDGTTRRTDWPGVLAGAVAAAHDVSWCDVRRAGASAYDVRRVQLRCVVAHRPHLVALAAGLVDVRRRGWDPAEVRSHLVHCAQELTERGAVLLTTGPHTRWPGGGRTRQLDEVFEELHERFGTIHLARGSRRSAADLADGFVRELARRGLVVPGPR